ncbi:threonine-phosphate decarboxylase CobD [Paenibacillus sp. MBLB4367]|uniref:threonine-phosphate decarboxylase CobD n=1 Tax=Paenibacillus sp. MBLB4367 TaxID=3384767 RepID=UPI0039081921
MLERYGHGGDLLTAAETFGMQANDFLDYSSNMNPFGPPAAVRTIFQERWTDIVKYPDPAVRELRLKIAERYGVPVESVLAGNGAAELIDLVVRMLRPGVTALARPSFVEYEEAVHKAGGGITDIPLYEENGFELSQEALSEAASRADLLFLGHPNNPTGRLIPQAVLESAVGSGKRVVLDEAFIDFCPEEEDRSFIRQAAVSESLFVIRSMTKFFAIPGIRLGFIVAHPDWIAKLRALQVAWSVNTLAQLIGAEVLADREYAQKTLDWLQAERPWLASKLESLGVRTYPSDTNFMLLRLPNPERLDVKQLQRTLGERGVLIRDASRFQGLTSAYLRIAIRLRGENERLVSELERAFSGMR